MGAGVQVIEKVARLRRFELLTSGSGDQRQIVRNLRIVKFENESN